MASRAPLPRAWKIAASLQLLAIVASGVALALYWAPEPHSDWSLYWRSAGDPGAYQRGGAALWLLAIPKALGAVPHVAALILNVPAAAWLGLLAYRVDRTRFRLFAQLGIAYLLLITPYFGIVQLDLVAAGMLATGFWLMMDQGLERPSPYWRMGLAVVAIAAAVSTRPQFALVLWTLLILLACGWIVGRRWGDRGLRWVALGLLLGSVIGFALDMGLRQFSGKTAQIRTSSAVTLYAGFLVSADSSAGRCGYWTPAAAAAAREDLRVPLPQAIAQRISARPASHWGRVLRCKAPQIVVPPAYALYWLLESPNVVDRRAALQDDGAFEALYRVARQWEDRLGMLLGLSILLACGVTTLRGAWSRRLVAALLPLGWVGAFWLVHAVFEIQGRYFLALYMIAPLLCAMAWNPGSPATGRTPRP